MKDFEKYKEIVSKFNVKQPVVDRLAKKINKKHWGKNKDTILNENN
jgi:hypothetical protein